ncbi:hypothetical protein J8I87_37595 [Paraburkholderia sp. LEh10]|uniref:hypothetical protein n=1 Tax=Paraburkholderia sp. LEh10 TaxID=2821353 RepID=UPI001AE84C59|nr:hypothetical protein [Paraburkholderia sp. LEh10]MBP0595272.1 hypothetical protein [Paraburkholderia sp. LEh10]
MLKRNGRGAIAMLVIACALAVTGCKERPREKSGGETIALSQVPAPVKATIDQQAQGRAVSEIEKRAANGTTQYAVTFGSGDQKQEMILDETGKGVATDDSEEDDD